MSRFSEAVIDKACYKLEAAPQGEFRRLPTPHELMKACEEATAVDVKKSRWCGRCNEGRVRDMQGEWHRCQCSCAACDDTGFTFEMRKGNSYALKCPNGCKPTGMGSAA